ncbi:hypothetical protein L1887_23815 [Cichorium endivia]|nr:hypothetical protein L1887_23815 [Cichorium endivia]
MTPASFQTTFSDVHPLIIQTQILPRLDGQSLSSVATASSYLRSLSSDDVLWSDICKSIWPSITHPRVNHVISTFPAGHRSFFQDSFMPLINDVKQPNIHRSWSNSQPDRSWPSELMSAVDIRYHDDIIYSKVEFTDTTTDFLSSALRIVLKDDLDVAGIPKSIDLKVEEPVHDDDATILHLKESITLNWILIDPTRKQAVNLSSIKPVLAWINNDICLRYAVVIPGTESNEMVEFRIEVKFAVGKGGVALHVREVTLHVQDLACNCLSGKDFLVIISRAFLEKYKTRRTLVVDEGGCHQKEWVKKEETVMCRVDYAYIMLILSSLLCFCFFDMLS